MFSRYASLLPALASLALAWAPPSYSGYTLQWSDSFAGSTATLPNSNNWNVITGNLGVNGELETYTRSTANVQLSGGSTLQLVPLKDSSVSGGWTSGRVESKYIFTPSAGKVTLAEANIRFGSNPTSNKQGIWPAFWILGNSIRSGTGWPQCGELDILEAIDGKLTGYGTAHCDVNPGGICNEPNGLGGSITIPDQSWHTWRMAWDRTPSNWQSETITWYMDGQKFHQITGSQIGNSDVWATLCHDPLYFILNVAVGGYWPGNPNSNTLDGYGSMMEIGYVAVYVS
ncbi:glycoside hydrolase family 16 protein [Aspergillus novofumigatus IBT 16806]|uniref:Putative endo-1,3(4)-beta-glucanase n=1 Tax=Aspergillus novofumigatus (strain IBT 16806) TaxID=1392255 RepID=A0A2I1CEJ1_ASPN1|nr:putative endo-1,3(4)-beta-glucanase [Aspergillus novofumigatus IBT 16806]PKX96018.1 putative endo-1,3(4)-beta-glucanase [Aspergillus novofumigatus IBT 16806]